MPFACEYWKISGSTAPIVAAISGRVTRRRANSTGCGLMVF
jgi:hypothetical protein